MPDPGMVIRIAANTAALKQALAEGRNEIVTTTAAMGRLANSLEGNKLIQRAHDIVAAVTEIGGATKLTEQEKARLNQTLQKAVEKYQALGKEAPTALVNMANATKPVTGGLTEIWSMVGKIGAAIGVSFGVGAIVGFAKEVGSFAGEVVDLNAQWQIGTSRIQAFNLAGAGVGLTLQSLTSSADQLQQRIGSGDASVVRALADLNLNIDELRGQKLDEVLFRIDEALVGVSNQFQRATLLTDLFGRSGAQMGRLMDGSLREVITAAEHSGAIIDEELIKKADAFDDAWSQAWIQFRASAVNAVGWVANALDELRMIAKRGIQFGGGGGSAREWQQGLKPLQPGERIVGGRVVTDSDLGIVQGGGIGSVIAESPAAKAMREWREQAAAAYRALQNQIGEEYLKLQGQFLAMSSSKETMALQSLAMRATPRALPLPLPNLNAGLTAGLMFGPGPVSQSPFGGVITQVPQSFVGGLTSGLKDVLGGMTGGGGLGGFLSKMGGSLVGGFGNLAAGALTGGLSSLASLAIGGLGKLFGGLFGAEGKKTNRERDAAIAAFTGIEGDKAASQAKFREMATEAGIAASEVDRLFSVGRVKDFQAAFERMTGRIREFTAEQEADQARLQAAIEKYGFTIDQIGPKLQQQRLNEQAKELIEDWRVLVGAGIDVETVNTQMADAINEYLQTAIRVGQEVPNAMRPIVQKMLEQGLLTDEAGNAITDLEAAGIHFAETMTEGFDRVVQKLDELIARIGLAGDALSDLPSVPEAPTGVWDASNVTPDDIVPMASGGRGWVSRPTLFLAGEAGPEEFAFSGAGRRLGGGDAGALQVLHAIRADLRQYLRTVPKEIAAQQAFALAQRA